MEDVPGSWVVGIGAVVLAPIIAPALAKAGKPLAKAAIKGGFRIYEQSRGAIAEAGEVFEDLVAEVQAELADEHQQGTLPGDYIANTTEATPESGN
jgi:hypothetical protein